MAGDARPAGRLGRPAGADQGPGRGRGRAHHPGLADLRRPRARASRPGRWSGSRPRAGSCSARPTRPSSAPVPTPSTRCSAPPAIRGTRRSPAAAPPAAPRWRWRPAWPGSPTARISAARCARRPRSAGSWACGLRPAACRTGPTPLPFGTLARRRARWPATCATSPCSSTCWPASTRATRLSYDAAGPSPTPRRSSGRRALRPGRLLARSRRHHAGRPRGRRRSAGAPRRASRELGAEVEEAAPDLGSGGRGLHHPARRAVRGRAWRRCCAAAPRPAEARGGLEHRARPAAHRRRDRPGRARARRCCSGAWPNSWPLRPAAVPGRDRAAVPGRAALPRRAERPPLPELHRLGDDRLRDHAHRLPGAVAALRLHRGAACRWGCRSSARRAARPSCWPPPAMLEDVLGLAGSVPIDPRP